MKIVHPYYFDPITVSSENPETLVIEKGDYLRRVMAELSEQYKAGVGQFVVSEDNQIKDLSKSVNLITDIFQLDLDGKAFKTRIQSYLANVCFDSEEGAQLVSKIKQYAYKLAEQSVYPITFESEFQLTDLIRFLDFRFYPDSDSMIESISEYMAGTMNILKKKLCITLNLKDFMNQREYREFVKQLQYKDVELLMIERHVHKELDDINHLRIIDKDLCVIE